MTEHSIVPVSLGERSYDIHIGHGLLPHLPSLCPMPLEGKNLFVLTDENVSTPHATAVYEILKSCRGESVQMLALPPGEQTKSMEWLEKVLAWLLDHRVNRDSVLFTVGGGVIGDLGGLAAALALRGIDCVQVPTTLLAQIDSSVGGKTAIDMPQGKNMVGAFHQPAAVICDLDTLSTLPRREILAGYAECMKYGLINDREFFIWLQKEGEKVCALDKDAVKKAVEVSCRKKAEIVEEDETEQGVRALLNLGHTFGHALESCAGFDGRLLHGEAVAIGMVLAFELSVRMGICDEGDLDLVKEHLSAIGLPIKAGMVFPPLDCGVDGVTAYMKSDKKNSSKGLRFILARGIGESFVAENVDMNDVSKVLEHSMEGTS